MREVTTRRPCPACHAPMVPHLQMENYRIFNHYLCPDAVCGYEMIEEVEGT